MIEINRFKGFSSFAQPSTTTSLNINTVVIVALRITSRKVNQDNEISLEPGHSA